MRAGASEQQILGHFSRRRDCIFPKCTLTARKYDAAQPREWRATHTCARTHTRAYTWGMHSHREACSRCCPTILLAPMRAASPRVSVSLYSHLTILPGVTVIRVRTTGLGADPLADLPFPHTHTRYSASASGMSRLLSARRVSQTKDGVRGVGCTKGSGVRCPLPRRN